MPDGAPPFTPRALKAEHAAYYVGLSVTTFHQQVAPAVPAVQLTPGRKAWLREDLDAWLDSRRPPVDRPRPDGEDAPPEESYARDPIAAGLANLSPARRARRPHQAR